MQINLPDIIRRVTHGLPLTQDEQRWLVEQVTGEEIPVRSRCGNCNATGVGLVDPLAAMPHDRYGSCVDCQGFGYVNVPREAVEVVR